MEQGPLRSPNAVPGLVLTSGFFNERERYFEDNAAFGRSQYGLKPPTSARRQVLPFLDPPDVLNLPSIEAIGVRGYPIVAGTGPSDPPIKALDTRALPVGRHQVCVCLAHEKVACGDVIEQPPTDDAPAGVRAQRYRRARVVLALGDARLEHRDWLPIAELERVREGGTVRSFLDEQFHPAIVDMRAWTRANPLSLFVSRTLTALGDVADDLLARDLRRELMLLHNVAETALPQDAFLQAQRCLMLLRSLAAPPLLLDGGLETFRFSQDGFPRFLSDLAFGLEKASTWEGRFPPMLEIGGGRYPRLDGFLSEDEEGWAWTPPTAGFVFNELALYLPHAAPGEVPHIKYGPTKPINGKFKLAEFDKRLSGPGVAALLEGLPKGVDRIYLTADAETKLQGLRQKLGDGYALYYR